jgi:membrane-associated PAP2 superfamily phosphatase
VIRKNTAGTNQTMQFNFFTFLGALIGGGCLLALAVMLFSNWASVTLLIAFVSGCIFGLILLILGANT